MNYVLSHWQASWAFLVLCAVAVALHLSGLRQVPAAGRGGHGPAGRDHRGREAAAFYGGVLAAGIAVVSPVGYWSDSYLWVRAVQDLLLAVIAPSLIVLGAPWLALAAGLAVLARRHVRSPPAAEGRRPSAPGGGPGWWLAWPLGVTIAFNIVWLGWHVPALYDLSATNAAVRNAEYATYLGTGILFWLQLIGSRPSSPAAPPMRRLAFLVGTAAADTVLGMVLVFGSGLLYPAYVGPAHRVLTVIADQQVAGAALWMGVLPSLIIVSVALLGTWLDNEERDDPSRDLEKLTALQTAGWRSRGGSVAARWPSGSRYRPPTA
jgi:putative membrane protein